MTELLSRPAAAQPFAAPKPRRTRRPSWLDLRLIAGIGLVLIAVVAGSAVVSSSDHRRPVWQLTHGLPAGAVLKSSDLKGVRVQLGSADATYVSSTEAVVGKAVSRDVRAGELLAAADLTVPAAGITVTVPLHGENAPPLNRGDRITLWATTKICHAVVVVSGAGVQEVKSASGSSLGGGSGIVVVMTLPPAQAERVISALDLESVVLRVGLLASGQAPATASAPLTDCEVAPK